MNTEINIVLDQLQNSAVISLDCAKQIWDAFVPEKQYVTVFEHQQDIGYRIYMDGARESGAPLMETEKEYFPSWAFGEDEVIGVRFAPEKYLELHFYQSRNYAVIISC